MKKVILSIVASAAIAITTLGQAPQAFKYQAVVRDASNTILTDQAVGFQLTIQEGSIGGTAVYTETFTPTSNSYGIINIEIGTGTTVDDFSTIDWANNSYFLETSIDVSGGSSYVVMGTSQFKSVPYALHAKTVENDIDEQILSYDNVSGELTISNGNTITLPMTTGGDNWGSQAAATDATLSGDGTSASPLSVQGDLTDDQNLTGATLTGTSLQIDIDNGSSATVDLAPLQDGVDDADADPTNELQDWSNLPGIPGDFSDGVDNVDDADNDPTNEIETWGTLGGIPADLQDGDDNTQLNEAQVDAFVANNGYITSPDDADADPTNELQNWSNLPGIPADFSDGTDDVDDADADPTNELQDWSNLPGIPAGFSDGVDNVDDADNDPTNEIETWGTLGGIPADLLDGDDNTQLNEAQVDAFVANNGYITSPDDADADPTNELQDWSNLPGIPAGFSDGVDNVDDADNDPTNEIETWGTLGGIPADLLDGDDNTQLNEAQVDAFVANNGYITSPDDADADPTNELQNWSNLPGIPADFLDGTDDVDDADADPTNELQNWFNLPGIPADFSDNVDNVDDADNDPTNEIETWGTLGGIPADLQDGDDNTQLNEAEVDAFVANNGYITSPDDADADPTNELQDLSFSGNTLSLTNDATTVDLSAYQSNTLDDAYDEGGAGSGRIITADAGTVEINGTGGLLVDANTTTYSDAISVYNSDGTNSTETYIGRVGVLSNNVWVQGVYGEAKLTSATYTFDGGFGVLGVVKHPTNGTVNLNASGTSAGISVNKAVGVGGTIGSASDYIGGPQDIIASVWGGTGLHNSTNGSVSGGAKLYAGLFQGNGRTLGLWGENSTYMELMPRWQVRDYDAGVIGFYNSDPDGGNNDADAGTGDNYLSIEANVTDATVKHVVLQTRTNGNVGIGTPSPGAKLDIHSAGAAIQIENSVTNHKWEFYTGGAVGNDGLGIYDRTNLAYRFAIDNAGFVGIGTATPSYPFHVTTTNTNTWQGRFTNGSSNVYLAHQTGYGMHINTGGTNSSTRYALDVRNASKNHFRIRDDGNIGMNTTAPTDVLSVNGVASKTGGGTWAVFSDARLKENITDYSEGLDFIKHVRPVNFSYNDRMEEIWGKDELNKGRIYQGVIAQELQKVAPDMVREVSVIKDGENEEQTTESFLEVDPNKFTYALINAVQEQQEQIEQQQELIQVLSTELYEIKAHLNLQTKKE